MSHRSSSTLFLILVFLCGGLFGAMVDRFWQKARRSGETAPIEIVERAKAELGLDASQCKLFDQILDDAKHDFDDLHSRAHSVRLIAKDRIRKILNEEQRKKFEAAMASLQKAQQ
jgi:enoyl-[acyl-carrier-protein] reductase (NADH)